MSCRVTKFVCAAAACLPMLGAAAQNSADTIPLGGNAWRMTTAGPGRIGDSTGGYIDNNGIGGWTDSSIHFDLWFRTSRTGDVSVWLWARAPCANNGLKVGLDDGSPLPVALGDSGYRSRAAGTYAVKDTGYHVLHIFAVRRMEHGVYADIPSAILQGTALGGRTSFVPNNEGNFFHWGRRGPSVHLSYPLPADFHASWFYNEVTVPDGMDIQGSYFMACGFSQGYFGMQVNGPGERHILFSVWSPFKTDDPASIPDSERIILVKKGPEVHTGSFGNEGSGGQSYLNYPWKAGQTYRFLLHAEPGTDRHTIFSAWWFSPEEGHWRLIASFSRPQTTADLAGLYSFLENFEPEMGNRERYVEFSHAWAGDATDHWISLHRARFTVDNTGRKGYRMDYTGGQRRGNFYLMNGGFFNKYLPAGTWLEGRADTGDRGPDIALPLRGR